MVRQIVCFQIPSLNIALARLAEPALRARPVAIAPPAQRTVLLEASAEAAAEGVYAGMPLDQARWRCPALKVVAPEPERARRAHAAVLDELRRFTPVWEPIRPGHFYLDLTGTARLFGRAVDTAARMERDVLERHGFGGVVGVATNKLVSHIAAEAILKPPDLYDVDPGGEKKFLAPLPVASLPSLHRLCGGKTAECLEVLDELDLATLGKVAATPLPHLELVLGARSRLMHQWAVGFDPTPVWPASARPALELSHTLAPDEVDDEALLAALYGLLERICRRLRATERLCRAIELALVQSDGCEFAGRAALDRPTAWESDIYPRMESLYYRLFQRRVRLRSVTLKAAGVEAEGRQLSLFPPGEAEEAAKMRRLSVALDSVRARFGKNAVSWGSA